MGARFPISSLTIEIPSRLAGWLAQLTPSGHSPRPLPTVGPRLPLVPFANATPRVATELEARGRWQGRYYQPEAGSSTSRCPSRQPERGQARPGPLGGPQRPGVSPAACQGPSTACGSGIPVHTSDGTSSQGPGGAQTGIWAMATRMATTSTSAEGRAPLEGPRITNGMW